jgi:hypothetical protein
MAVISISQAQGIYTDKLQAIFIEKIAPTDFFRSFFPIKESNTKLVSIAVRRTGEQIAVDTQRGTGGNRNTFGKGSRKTFLPPYFEEYLEATEMGHYDAMWTGTGTVEIETFAQWLADTVEALDELIFKIDRAYELYCAQALELGILTLEDGSTIDFKRKTASLVAYAAAHKWATNTVSPYAMLEQGCNFLRTKGKSTGTVFNCIMGSTAHADFMANEKVLARNDIQHINLDSIAQPQRVANATLHGKVTAGSFTVNIWTYNEYYDTKDANHNKYMNEKKIIILPENPKFNFMYAGIPQLLMPTNGKSATGLSAKKGRYHISEFLDVEKASHQIKVKSAGIPVLVAVDQVFTAQVVS